MLWKEIAEAPGYFVSKAGAIKGPKSEALSLQYYRNGYQYVWLFVNKKPLRKRVHRLVMQTFKPITHYMEVNHINGVIDDNRLENLEWCTSSQNKIHARDSLGKYNPKPIIGTNIHTGKQIKILGINEAKKFGFSPQNISACLNGRRKLASNHTWEFDNGN